MLARWRAAPLRARLVVLTTALLLVGLGVSGLTSAALLRTYLLDQLDGELTGSAQELGQRSLDQLQAGRGSDAVLPSDYYVRIQHPNGTVLELISARTEQTVGRPAVAEVEVDSLAGMSEPFTVGNESGTTRWRAVHLPLTGADRSTVGAVTVALPMAPADLMMHRIGWVLTLSAVAVAAAGAFAAWYLVRRELRPLREIETTAEAIAAGDLSRRVPDGEPATEVGSLALSLNTMLAQIEQAFAARYASEQRMRRFVSDASHELRTPLATVRGYGELYRMGAIEADAVPATMERIESEAKRMGSLVEDLLQLARLDEGRSLERTEVDLGVLAVDAVADLRALAPDRPAAVVPFDDGAADRGPVRVLADENRLRQVVTNLVGNVVQHTPAGTPVEIAVGHHAEDPRWAILRVVDHGPGIADSDAARVFERFYRVDHSRARASGGSGLGLAIVAAIVGAHRGAVRLEPTPGGGTTVEVALPGLR